MPITDIESLDHKSFLIIKNARQNNLKGISLAIPQQKLTVITGVSGSGKSSLAFDTLYAEGQRRYVESLSAYVRQFMGKINKPAVDYIRGLSPAVAIQQKVNTNNPRSTVGTATEIYDYLRLLYARIGKTYSPESGELVQRDTIDSVVKELLTLPTGNKVIIATAIVRNAERSWPEELNIILQKGFNRLYFNQRVTFIEDILAFINGGETWNDIADEKLTIKKTDKLLDAAYLLIDRLSIEPDNEEIASRMADSVQTAFFEGMGNCVVINLDNELTPKLLFSDKFEKDGIEFLQPTVNLFTFNNPYGACKVCEGFGSVIGIDEDKVIPDKNISVYDGAVAAWRGESMNEYKEEFISKASPLGFPIHRPYNELSKEERLWLWNGKRGCPAIKQFFAYLESKTYKIQYRVLLARYKGKTKCMDCEGTRLRIEASYVKIASKSISDLVDVQCNELKNWFDELKPKLSDTDYAIAQRILTEIDNRLTFLIDVGLGYLSLNRAARTLSGGESQRIQIVTSLGSNLTGALYILDEPSIGLHSRDTEKLITVLRRLQRLGNTVLVVEHDEDVMRQADEVVDIGPGAGTLGGHLTFQGNLEQLLADKDNLTAQYLTGAMSVAIPEKRRPALNFIEFKNCDKNNLKGFDVKFPLNCISVVTGVSGSGKSSLMKEVVMPLMRDAIEKRNPQVVASKLSGSYKKVIKMEFIDQDPIGKSSRSNPVTYMKAFDAIRDLYSKQPSSKQRGFTPAYFSFNVDGGRCDVCKGEGIQTIEMQFMADVEMICENCNGARYKSEVLEVKYQNLNIADVLKLTVAEAITFFAEHKDIISNIMPLQKVGLGYLHLGQPSIHLSGGEAQRIKLAVYLQKINNPEPILFIFDEPTTGLHFHDINTLMESMYALIDNGHTVIIIEHNLDVIKTADWLVDLGPEAGDEGGNLVYQGVPEGLLKIKDSHTGKYLKDKLKP